jgi:hypothetical protein
MGGFFGVMWGAVMWLLQWQFWLMPWDEALAVSAGAGLLFGLAMAGYYRWRARKLGLPSWDRYPDPS